MSDPYLIDIDRYFIWEGPANDITETKHIWCHIEDIFANACIGNCHFDNFQCSQWHIFFSMKTFPFQWFLYALPEIDLFLLWNIWVVSYLHTIYLVDRQSFKRCYSTLSFKQYSVTPAWYQQKRINSALNEIFRPSQIRYQWHNVAHDNALYLSQHFFNPAAFFYDCGWIQYLAYTYLIFRNAQFI